MLITEKYTSVVATKYRLQTRVMKEVDGKDKQVWDINCPARKAEGKKLQVSEYVEEMNSIDNNIYYEIDVEATEKAQELIEKKNLANKEKKKDAHLSTSEAIGKLADAITKDKAPTKEVDPELEELRTEWKEVSGKKRVSPDWDADKLREKIAEVSTKS